MSTNERKPRRTFDQDFIAGAVKLVTQEGTAWRLRPRPSMFHIRLCGSGVRSNLPRVRRQVTRLDSSNSNRKIVSSESSYGRPSWSVKS